MNDQGAPIIRAHAQNEPNLALLPSAQPQGPNFLLQHPRVSTGAVFMVAGQAVFWMFLPRVDILSSHFLFLSAFVDVSAFLSGCMFAPLLRRPSRAPLTAATAAFCGVLIVVVAQILSLTLLILFNTATQPSSWSVDIVKSLLELTWSRFLFITPYTAPAGAVLAFALYLRQTPATARTQLLGCGSHAQLLEKSE